MKNFAISVFGANDKMALVTGILIVLAIFAALIGVAAMRRLAYGYAGLVIFAAIGLAAALSRPGATFGYAVPTILGAAVGAFALSKLIRAALEATPPSARPRVTSSARAGVPPDRYAGLDAASAGAGAVSTTPIAPPPSPPATPPPSVPTAPAANTGATDTGGADTRGADAGGADTRGAGPERVGAGGAGPGATPPVVPPGPKEWVSTPPPGESWTYQSPSPPSPGRRRFLVVSTVTAGGAALAALAGRELNARQSVTQARATIRIPAPSQPAPRSRPARTCVSPESARSSRRAPPSTAWTPPSCCPR